jgi:hypothetical protein
MGAGVPVSTLAPRRDPLAIRPGRVLQVRGDIETSPASAERLTVPGLGEEYGDCTGPALEVPALARNQPTRHAREATRLRQTEFDTGSAFFASAPEG